MTYRDLFRIIVLFVLGVVPIGCGRSSDGTPTAPTTTAPRITSSIVTDLPPVGTTLSTEEWIQWSKRWLQGTPCSAPCWEGITPGKTTIGEALAILQNNPTIRPGSVSVTRKLCGGPEGIEIAYSRELVWEWTLATYGEGGVADYAHRPPFGAQAECLVDSRGIEDVELDEETLDSVITRIELKFAFPPKGFSLLQFRPSLGEAMRAYGEPNYIVAVESPEFSWYYVNAIFGSHGVVLKRVSRVKLTLDDQLDFTQAVFSNEPFRDGVEYFHEKVLIPWQGMQNFDFYCRHKNGKPCR